MANGRPQLSIVGRARELKRNDQNLELGNDTSFDGGGGGGYDGLMEERVKKLEQLVDKIVERIANIERDVAVVKSNYATKADVSEAKNSIIMWVVGAIFVAQLLPMIKEFVKPAAAPPQPAAQSAPAPAPTATPTVPTK